MEELTNPRNFKEYKVWQDAVEFASKIYKTTATLPWFEKKGLCDQLQRAVVSIGSNIAEGAAKPSDADFARFLDTALGSSFEVETQLLISKNIGYINEETFLELQAKNALIQKQLVAFIRKIRNKK